MILRPFLVLLRARNPWVRLRLMLEGWYVRFMALARFPARKKMCAARCFPPPYDDRPIGSCRRWVAISSNGSEGCQTLFEAHAALIAEESTARFPAPCVAGVGRLRIESVVPDQSFTRTSRQPR